MEERERNMRREIEMKRERLGEERMEKVVRMDREDEGVSPPPSKRMHHDEDEDEDEAQSPTPLITVAAAATNIKITSRGQYLVLNLTKNKKKIKIFFKNVLTDFFLFKTNMF